MKSSNFDFSEDLYEEKYDRIHDMLFEIQVACWTAYYLLNIWMEFMTGKEDISKQSAAGIDMDIDSSIRCGLQKSPDLADIKIMGAIIHPQFQGSHRMVAAVDLYTEDLYETSRAELLDRITCLSEGNDKKPRALDEPKAFHKFDEVCHVKSSPHVKQDDEELEWYNKYKNCDYLLEV